MAKTTITITGTVLAGSRLVSAATAIDGAAYDASAISSIAIPTTADGKVDIYAQYPVNGVYEATPPTARLHLLDSITCDKPSTTVTGRVSPIEPLQPAFKVIAISTSSVDTTLTTNLITAA